MEKKNKIGILTFHAAHNYGSVLQAYATQAVIEEMGFENEIINYRLNNQRKFYNSLYSSCFGFKPFLRRMMRVVEHGKRKSRCTKFERFLHEKLKITREEYRKYQDLTALKDSYKVLLSGSDQIWNEHCTAEFKTEPKESIWGYYLAFAGEDTIKISFSTSFGGMTREEMEKYAGFLGKYHCLSVREEEGRQMLSEVLEGREVENTLDPTLLLCREQWKTFCYHIEKCKEKYILVYTLRQYRAAMELLERVRLTAGKFSFKVKCVTPFSIVPAKMGENAIDSSPEEFVALVRDASLVITDSFHGTAFAVNFGIPFYVLEHSKDNRKQLLLKKLGLEDRILFSYEELDRIPAYDCDFTLAHKLLEEERNKSRNYLKTSLGRYF